MGATCYCHCYYRQTLLCVLLLSPTDRHYCVSCYRHIQTDITVCPVTVTYRQTLLCVLLLSLTDITVCPITVTYRQTLLCVLLLSPTDRHYCVSCYLNTASTVNTVKLKHPITGLNRP